MYFAVNECPEAQLLTSLLDAITAHPQHDTRWYALMDQAFDHDERPPLRWHRPVGAIYRMSGAEQISPLLLELPPALGEELADDLMRLIRHAQSRPMLSFVQTTLSLDALCEAWQSIKWVETSDGQKLLFRFADARGITALPTCLSADHWARVCDPLVAWHVASRTGALQALPMPGPEQRSASQATLAEQNHPFRITDAELDRLMDASLPDALIDALHERVPDALLMCERKADAYEWVRGSCALAKASQMDSSEDQLALAAAVCLSGGTLLRHPELPSLLAAHKGDSAALTDALVDLLPNHEEAFE